MLALLLGMPLASLKVIDLRSGTGPQVFKGDIVTVLYRGTLASGRVFDSTDGRSPFAFNLGVGQVIPGWERGIAGMRAGGKRKLIIPPGLAYGNNPQGEIPPGSTLTFVVEVLRIDKKSATPKVQVTPMRPGTGLGAKKGDTITLHYRGLFLNGFKFDASYDRKEPFEVILGQTRVIPGFTQGLMGIKVGEKRKVTIPYQLAYGDKGRPPVIPRFSTLVFQLEALKVSHAKR